MLTFLQIQNYAIIEALDLDFATGFTCITGETGAGKSIMVGALGLLTGQRADTSAIRSDCKKAELIAEFELAPGNAALEWLRERELDDGSLCLLRRIIADSGRSRAWINGSAVSLQQLAELGALLVEIHGQNEHLRLLKPRAQMDLLDQALANSEVLAEVNSAHADWRNTQDQMASLLAEAPLDANDVELLEFHLRELEPWIEDSARFTQIESEHRMLSRSDEFQHGLNQGLDMLDNDEGISATVSRITQLLEPMQELDQDIASALTLLKEAQINCEEARIALASACEKVTPNPEKLADLDRRLVTLHDLARKHRSEPENLVNVMERLNERLKRSADRDQQLEHLGARAAEQLNRYRKAAKLLTAARSKEALRLSADVSKLMQQLGLEGGSLDIKVESNAESEPSSRGDDRIAFYVTTNAAQDAAPLGKIASGGELSRISLAIKVASKQQSSRVTQVFDEVDAGIGGETAASVGALIQSLSVDGQSLCVTHLAQVAVFADQQIVVRKSGSEAQTSVETRLISADQRIDEIARMLGGKLSEQGRAHASELLEAATVRH